MNKRRNEAELFATVLYYALCTPKLLNLCIEQYISTCSKPARNVSQSAESSLLQCAYCMDKLHTDCRINSKCNQ